MHVLGFVVLAGRGPTFPHKLDSSPEACSQLLHQADRCLAHGLCRGLKGSIEV
jgi:hypothetical protein